MTTVKNPCITVTNKVAYLMRSYTRQCFCTIC